MIPFPHPSINDHPSCIPGESEFDDITLPYLLFVLLPFVNAAYYLLIGDARVVVVDAGVLNRVTGMDLIQTAVCSLVMNAVSVGLGLCSCKGKKNRRGSSLDYGQIIPVVFVPATYRLSYSPSISRGCISRNSAG